MSSARESILTDLHTHGPATAATIADRTGLGYSTVTATLRRLAAAGHAHRDGTNNWTAVADTSAPPAAAATSDVVAASDPEPAGPDAQAVEPADPADTDVEHADGPADGEPQQPHAAGPAESPDRNDPNHDPAPSTNLLDRHGDRDPGAGRDPDAERSDGDVAASTPRRRYNRSGKPVRKKKQLQNEVLAYLTARPGQQLTPHAIAKAVDAADGAVINACNKLAHDGAIERVETTKAMFVYHTPAETA
jgi:MarR family